MGGNYSGLRIQGIEDLSFLKDYPLLRYLEIDGNKPVDMRQLSGLSNLRGLLVESAGSGINFEWFPELEVFTGTWHADNHNLSSAHELRTMRIWKYAAKEKNLSVIANITRLETLHLTQTPIESLDGLETLEDLRYLDVAYAPKLASLSAFTACSGGLREVSIQNARGIASYQSLSSLSNLRLLILSSCAPMADLHWILSLQRLDFFSFMETNVVDGDLSPLLRLPCLRYVGTFEKRHYNMTSGAVMEALSKRSSDGVQTRTPSEPNRFA